MYQIILVIHVLVAISLIGLVLLQRGKGADVGAAFGAGASQTVFGSRGSGSFLLRMTTALAAVFFATSLGLGYIAGQEYKQAQHAKLPVPIEEPVEKTLEKQDALSVPHTLLKNKVGNEKKESLPESS